MAFDSGNEVESLYKPVYQKDGNGTQNTSQKNIQKTFQTFSSDSHSPTSLPLLLLYKLCLIIFKYAQTPLVYFSFPTAILETTQQTPAERMIHHEDVLQAKLLHSRNHW